MRLRSGKYTSPAEVASQDCQEGKKGAGEEGLTGVFMPPMLSIRKDIFEKSLETTLEQQDSEVGSEKEYEVSDVLEHDDQSIMDRYRPREDGHPSDADDEETASDVDPYEGRFRNYRPKRLRKKQKVTQVTSDGVDHGDSSDFSVTEQPKIMPAALYEYWMACNSQPGFQPATGPGNPKQE